MLQWIPTIIEGLVFLSSLVGVLVKTSTRIRDCESKIQNMELRINELAVSVSTMSNTFVEIQSALARIETDIQWLKNKK